MRTEVLSEPRAAAWLEFYPPSGSGIKKYPLPEAAFTLGRSETTDLPVNSNRVSREHATIERRGGGWRIRDLKSTNGTFVNGERIEESPLHDGDSVKVADVEFSFHAQSDLPTLSFTQVMGDDGEASRSSSSADGLSAWVRTLRSLRELLLRGGPNNRYLPIYSLAAGELFGYEAVGAPDPARSLIERQIIATECLLSERLRHVQRLAAVEETAALGDGLRIVVSLVPSEIGARPMFDALELLQARAGARPLIVALPVAAVCDTSAFREFLAELRARRIGVLYDQFAGRATHASLAGDLAADYVKLASSMTRGVEHSSDRQRQIQAIVRACADADCQVAVQGVGTAAADICRDLGCTLAEGDVGPSTTNHEFPSR